MLLEADKGYDAMGLRIQILSLKIFPFIPYRKSAKKKEGIRYLERHRWKVERTIAWLQRAYRRLAVKWERKLKYWLGFLTMALLLFWVKKLSG